VFIVTGASSGIGEQLAQILYQKNAKVYVAARSEEKASKAIERIKANAPNSKGELRFLHLDLDDLATIKASAEAFLSENDRLDVLWNNAGVMVPPQGSKTKQGYEKQLGTNNVAPFLFTKLLLPILARTASTAPKDSVRVVWVSSSGAEVSAPKGGVDLGNLDYKVDKGTWLKYGASKAGNLLHAGELAKRAGPDGIISVVRLVSS
jgi:retinol dehydrogenase 12